MYDNDFKILGLGGSLRRASFHRGLIRAARELALDGVSVEPYEGLNGIPFFNLKSDPGISQTNPTPIVWPRS